MIKKLLIGALISFSFSNELNEFLTYQQNLDTEFMNYNEQLNENFNKYKNELNKGFKEYKKSLSKYWKHPELSSKKVFVQYSKDMKIKNKIDYSKNEIEISVISKDKKDAIKSLQKSLASLVTENTNQAFNKNPVLKKVHKKLVTDSTMKNFVKLSTPSKEPLVEDMVFKTKPSKLKVQEYVNTHINYMNIKQKPSKLKDMYVYTVKIALPPKSLLIKAQRYKTDVFSKAKRFDIKPALIYAVIHTESSFNPMARSYIPAFGLMQIVPQTAGMDAYKKLYNEKKILSPSYLYNYHNNILIGTAYLNEIYYQYMKNIKDPISRFYCTIAAYNTGVGNVACTFNKGDRLVCNRSRGDYNINKASKIINQMTSGEVFNYLLNKLPYDETKNYLKRVSKRFLMYSKVIDNHGL